MDVQCIFVDPVTRRASLGLGSKILTGPAKLFQLVVLSLLNNPGKDVLDPGKGGGLPSMIGANFDHTDTTEVFSEVARRVKKTQTEILQDQIGLHAPADERLSQLHVVSIKPGVNIDQVDVKLRIVSETGKAQDVVL